MITRILRSLLYRIEGPIARDKVDYTKHLRLYKEVTHNKGKIPIPFKEAIKKANSVGLLINRSEYGPYWYTTEPYLKGKTILFKDDKGWDTADIYVVNGIGKSAYSALKKLNYMQAPCYVIEESFLRSVAPISMKNDKTIPQNYFKSISYTFDAFGPAFYPGIQTQIERHLNSSTQLTNSEKVRVQKLIKFITEKRLSKYNTQPDKKPQLKESNRPKVLIVDQAYQDFSVLVSGGDTSSFEHMLDCAIQENPSADIIIKSHVDRVSRPTYFSKISIPKNVTFYTENINPLRMIQAVDKVYTYSSTMGFEALMCNKEVRTFGSPIYAGWGLTKDERPFKDRRTQTRSIEDLFYFIYIEGCLYSNPSTNKICEIEEALKELVKQRAEYMEMI